MADISPEKIAEWKKLCAEATPGPWFDGPGPEVRDEYDELLVDNFYGSDAAIAANAAFIAAAREALPVLLSIAEAARVPADRERLVERLEAPHDWGYRDETGKFIADSAPFDAAAALRRWPRPTPGELDVLISRATDTVPPLPGGNHD